jgi:REP element-mobilizing transposase RayT
MPDHFHAIILGLTDSARPKLAMDSFKQASSLWLAENRPRIHWQKSYYDHIIRASEDWHSQVRYILRNPVRRQFVLAPMEYPFSGSIGYDFREFVASLGWREPGRRHSQRM